MLRLLEPIRDGGALPLFGDEEVLPRVRQRRAAQLFLKHILLNRFIREILDGLPDLDVTAWLTAGCLVQTAWNLQAQRRPHEGIDDYDLIYFDPDVSWESEDRVIKRAAAVYGHLPIRIEIRNQARVPLWYRPKFLIDFPPVRNAEHAVLRFPSRTTAIAVTRFVNGEYAFYAPFGFRDALMGRVRPNFRLPLEQVYNTKVARWRQEWPALRVEPWRR